MKTFFRLGFAGSNVNVYCLEQRGILHACVEYAMFKSPEWDTLCGMPMLDAFGEMTQKLVQRIHVDGIGGYPDALRYMSKVQLLEYWLFFFTAQRRRQVI